MRSLFLLGLLAACGSSPPPAETTPEPTPTAEQPPANGHVSRPPDEREAEVVRQLLAVAERVRELTFERTVDVSIENREAITARMLEEATDPDLDRALLTYSALGLLDEGTDVRALLARVLGEQVVGYYDTDQRRLVIRDDVAQHLQPPERGFDESSLVLVHEIVHALQDQRLGLSENVEIERDTDADNAYHALVEGDATLAMFGYVAELAGRPLSALTSDPHQLRELVERSMPAGNDELSRAPAILRIPLVAAYIEGFGLNATLHSRGGFRDIDAAFRAPPTTTEQVLHPERYLAHEAAEPVALPALAELEEAGLTVNDEDTLGELELSVYFGQLAQSGVDREAAAGWGGDRLRSYRRTDGHGAVVWFVTFDDEANATEAERGAERIRSVAREPATQLVERRGRALLIVRGVPAALHDVVKREFASFAASLRARS